MNDAEAFAPATVALPDGGRVLVFALAFPDRVRSLTLFGAFASLFPEGLAEGDAVGGDMDVASTVNYGRTLQEPMFRLRLRDHMLEVFDDMLDMLAANGQIVWVGAGALGHNSPPRRSPSARARASCASFSTRVKPGVGSPSACQISLVRYLSMPIAEPSTPDPV